MNKMKIVLSLVLLLMVLQSKSQNLTAPVGIGTTTPAFPLDVNGVAQFAGGTKIGNSSTGFYGDGANHAIRAFNVANSGFHIQSYNGVYTYM